MENIIKQLEAKKHEITIGRYYEASDKLFQIETLHGSDKKTWSKKIINSWLKVNGEKNQARKDIDVITESIKQLKTIK